MGQRTRHPYLPRSGALSTVKTRPTTRSQRILRARAWSVELVLENHGLGLRRGGRLATTEGLLGRDSIQPSATRIEIARCAVDTAISQRICFPVRNRSRRGSAGACRRSHASPEHQRPKAAYEDLLERLGMKANSRGDRLWIALLDTVPGRKRCSRSIRACDVRCMHSRGARSKVEPTAIIAGQ